MGRSRGGLSAKINTRTDARGRPIRFAFTLGQAPDGQTARELLDDLAAGTVVLADKGYDADWIRAHIEHQGAAPNIPDKANRRERHCFSRALYRGHNRIECPFN